MNTSFIRTASVATIALLSLPLPAPAQEEIAAELALAQAATANLRTLEAARAAGYSQFHGCIEEPGKGAMGIHFVNEALAGDAVLNPARPEALLFAPGAAGTPELVGVEYIVFRDTWHAGHAEPPALFGHPLHLTASPNRYGIPAFYALHVWIWRLNPSGTFADWNPQVGCADRHGDAGAIGVLPAHGSTHE
ncbi:MAG TPA: hypothetical protein VM491_20990 [Burkholderiaceae bacterium]|jgi:hypothetical protein|nr:hypothetical protein [Burkholderiaceae bacterium]